MAAQLIEGGRDFEAVEVLKRLLGREPDNPDARLMIAQALIGAGIGDMAEQHLRHAAAFEASAGMALGMLGYWLQARGRFAEARDCFERSIAARPGQSASYYGWAQGNRFTRDEPLVLDLARRQIESGGLAAEEEMILQYVLGKAHSDFREFEISIGHYDRANDLAFQQMLGGIPFDRSKYRRVVDGSIATFSRETFKLNRGIGYASRIPIFIVGMMRSGTTLVEQIISSHPQVGAAGEVDFWLDEGPSLLDLDSKRLKSKLLPVAAKRYLADLESRASGYAFITDKMPQNFQMVGLIHLAFPNAPIIHIKRNPIDTCLSIYMTAYERSPAFAHDRESIVFAYREYMRLVQHWRRVIPEDRFLEISYEDLVAEPESITRKLIAFCRLPWNDACLRPDKNERIVSTPSLWQVRQPIYRSSTERWRDFEPWLGAFRKLL